MTFLEVVARPVLERGYHWVRKTQSLAYHDGDVRVVLVRLGGRFARPGAIAHILCARHCYLRTLVEETVPVEDPPSVNDYPFKFAPSALFGVAPEHWSYRPMNLGHWQYDQIEYATTTQASLRHQLTALRHLLADIVPMWARSLSPGAVLQQLQSSGENAWCERLWMDDYRSRMARAV